MANSLGQLPRATDQTANLKRARRFSTESQSSSRSTQHRVEVRHFPWLPEGMSLPARGQWRGRRAGGAAGFRAKPSELGWPCPCWLQLMLPRKICIRAVQAATLLFHLPWMAVYFKSNFSDEILICSSQLYVRSTSIFSLNPSLRLQTYFPPIPSAVWRKDIKENQREKIPTPPSQCQNKLSLRMSVFVSI